jgi:UDP-N-acetylglucosamine 2-epimerase
MPILYLVAGARPNFMKIAPIVRALQAHGGLDYQIIHTGQHYDREMNDVFFEELGIPAPDVFMGAGGGSHAQQTAKIMTAFEELCQANKPDAVLVVGDVNSTLACSIVAKKLHIPVAHVEAGLQEETTALGVPCITIRENTERPITVEEGTNVLAGTDPRRIVEEARKVLRGEGKQGRRPHLWDGRAAERIVAILANALDRQS